MSNLFEPAEIRGMKLRNRIVRSATWEGMAQDTGEVTPALANTWVRLAEGEVGLIITGHAFVSPEGQASPWQTGIYADHLVEGLLGATQAVHQKGGSIVLQLAHAGLFALTAKTGVPALAPSLVEGLKDQEVRVLEQEGIEELVQAFGRAARRAREAGFDGIQVHAAHGYLLSQFLSLFYNHRKDGYGQSLENRVRPAREVVKEVRSQVGPDYPVLVKMNSQDFLEGGLTLEDSLKAAKLLVEAGVDAVEVSGGTFASGMLNPSRMRITSPDREAYFQDAARAFRANLGVPVILVGGIRSLEVAEDLLNSRVADFISLSRPLIREPGLAKRWREGNREKARCISDNQCFRPAMKGQGIYCVNEQDNTH